MSEASPQRASHALFPGTFDPVTLGHLDLIRRGAALFERVTIAVAAHPSKNQLLGVEERLELLRRSTSDLPGVEVVALEGLVVHGCEAHGADVLLRGVRSAADFDYEMQMARTNRVLLERIDTVLLASSPEHAHISSTLVRQVASMGGDLSAFVPEPVVRFLEDRYPEGRPSSRPSQEDS